MILPVLPWLIKMSDNCGLFCNFVSFSIFYDSFGSYSWFCYAVLLAAGCCPVWILFLCAILTGKESWIRLFRQPICKFATAALLIPLIYFTICRNENPAMILICFPALSLLIPLGIQAYFNNGGHHRSFDWMLNFWALLLLVCGFTAVGLWFFPAYAAVIMEKLPLSSLSLIVFGVSALLGGGALLYSFRGNWRSRLYLYFFSIALLPLGISWCVTSNYQIPEKNIRHLMDNSDVIVDKCEFFTTEELVAAVKWCGGKSVNIVDCACPLLEIADSGKTVCLIVEENHPSLQNFEKFPVFRSNGLAFVKITTGNPAAERNSDVL
jgi:4-amino-4-deoxy-L-arabinose transferase-like glycosyltransferase